MKTNFLVFIFLAIIMLGCKKEDNNSPDPDPGTEITIDSKPSFQGTINGKTFSYDQTNSVSVQGASLGIAYYPDTSEFTYNAHLSSLDFDTTFISIYIGTLYLPGGGSPTNEEFSAFFKTGTLPYSANLLNGIEIRYWDEDNTMFSTAFGTANQNNSTFMFDELKEEPFYNRMNIKFKASFDCYLYDESGNFITLTNGVYVNYFANM